MATNWDDVPWTKWERCALPTDMINALDPATAIYRNSRYQVTVYTGACGELGPYLHLSLKVHDRSARHDWRDLQRIKNEICGADCEAVELFPAERRLVDTANQYHLYVFQPGFRLPFGFNERLVGDGTWQNSLQRPWPAADRPPDCIDADQYDQMVKDRVAIATALNPNPCTDDRHQNRAALGGKVCPHCGINLDGWRQPSPTTP